MKYELTQYEAGKIHQGATEFTCKCAQCGLQDVMHSHTGVDGAVDYFRKEGWLKKDKLWYCPGCSSSKDKMNK